MLRFTSSTPIRIGNYSASLATGGTLSSITIVGDAAPTASLRTGMAFVVSGISALNGKIRYLINSGATVGLAATRSDAMRLVLETGNSGTINLYPVIEVRGMVVTTATGTKRILCRGNIDEITDDVSNFRQVPIVNGTTPNGVIIGFVTVYNTDLASSDSVSGWRLER